MNDSLPIAGPDAQPRSLRVLRAHDVARPLHGRERQLIDLAAQAYLTHGRGQSCLPAAEALRLPGQDRERIVARPGYLGGAHPAAGIKWISSFPDNLAKGLPRTSALIVLNSLETGRPTTVMEGSLITSQRTAASAALAARVLHRQPSIGTLGLMGCGLIGREMLRFVLADGCPVERIMLFDLHPDFTRSLVEALAASGFGGRIDVADSEAQLLQASELLLMATNAVKPSIDSLAGCDPRATILHVSLRDLTANAVLQADNLCDDVDQVLQAPTSLHRTQQLSGSRTFLRGTLAEVLEGRIPARAGARPVVFHPAGLAALDIAFAQFVAQRCLDAGLGIDIPEFLV